MAVAEKQLSPEEKLQKVIQSGGEEKKQPTPEEKMLAAVKPPAEKAPAAKASPPPAPVKPAEARKDDKKAGESKPAPAAGEEKSKLKVLKTDAAAEEKEASGKTLIGAPGPGVIGAGPAPVAVAGRSGRKFSMGAVNRGLAAAILVILTLTGLEIRGAVRKVEVVPLKPLPQTGEAVAPAGNKEEMPSLESIVAGIKDLFPPRADTAVTPDGPKPPPPQLAGRLKLMGFSKDKAIVRDIKDEKMFITGKGEKILVGEQMLELIQMEQEKGQVIFSDGQNSIPVKP